MLVKKLIMIETFFLIGFIDNQEWCKSNSTAQFLYVLIVQSSLNCFDFNPDYIPTRLCISDMNSLGHWRLLYNGCVFVSVLGTRDGEAATVVWTVTAGWPRGRWDGAPLHQCQPRSVTGGTRKKKVEFLFFLCKNMCTCNNVPVIWNW